MEEADKVVKDVTNEDIVTPWVKFIQKHCAKRDKIAIFQ